MGWSVIVPDFVEKELKKMDPHVRAMIQKKLRSLDGNPNAHLEAKALKGPLAGLSSFRAEKDYRIVGQLFDEGNEKFIGVVKAGHRKDIYLILERMPEEKRKPFGKHPPPKDPRSR